MKVAVCGLWHLGCVTAACLSNAGNQVVGLDVEEDVVAALKLAKPPLEEPGLSDLIAGELLAGRLSFTNDPAFALRDAEVLWVAFDTPVNERDEADVNFVRARLEAIRDHIRPGTLVLISSQVPVGFTRSLRIDWAGKNLKYAYSPENLRLGRAIEAFRRPERVIIGLDNAADRPRLAELFMAFCTRIEWMSLESAEMTKHALNAFLAVSVTFINELARLCEAVGADAKEVERGLKSEGRIGPKAYLAPGAAFAGGTLARDVRFLVRFGEQHGIDTPLLGGILASNDQHKSWTCDKVQQLLDGISDPVVAVLGLTYKPGTNTLRRSAAVELCGWLHQKGVKIQAHDPAIRELPAELNGNLSLKLVAADALRDADVAVIATEWPHYRAMRAEEFVSAMRRAVVIDQNWFLAEALASDPRIRYIATGKGAGV